MSDSTMRDFWDARAEEDPFFFVDNRVGYGSRDLERFWTGGREQLDHMHALLEIEPEEGGDVVEIGCGVGRITRVLAERAATVTAIDVSERMLEVADELNPGLDNVRWMLGDGSSLAGVDDESADFVHSYVVFHHIPDPEITLGYVREIARVLRPGGRTAFQVSNELAKHRPHPVVRRLKLAWRALRGRGPRGQNHPAWRGSPVSVERLREVADESGLAVDRIVGEGTIRCFVLLRKRAV